MWIGTAILKKFLKARGKRAFRAEHVAAFATQRYPRLHQLGRQWGPVMQIAARAGKIERIGYTNSIGGHRHRVSLWQSKG